MRGEIIWNKAASAKPSTAWGTYLSPRNPVLRDIHEYILVFSKESFARKQKGKEATIREAEFREWTKSVWTFPTASAQMIGHPAPFPEELPHRLIQLYTFRDDTVLDPFAGSGTTAIAALKSGRSHVGYETNPAYVRLAKKRIALTQAMLSHICTLRDGAKAPSTNQAGLGVESKDNRVPPLPTP
jgi:modification methylase